MGVNLSGNRTLHLTSLDTTQRSCISWFSALSLKIALYNLELTITITKSEIVASFVYERREMNRAAWPFAIASNILGFYLFTTGEMNRVEWLVAFAITSILGLCVTPSVAVSLVPGWVGDSKA